MRSFQLLGQDTFRSIICGNIRAHHKSVFLHSSVDALLDSSSVEFYGIFEGANLASFACVSPRLWNIDGNIVHGCSIGVVTTLLEYRNMGYASLLIASIQDYMISKSNIEFVYLQGIHHFYSRLGFSGFAPKRKFIVDTVNVPHHEATIRSARRDDLPKIVNLFENYSKCFESYVMRDRHVWNDLLGPLKNSFLFFMPRIVEDSFGQPYGYFCTSPDDPRTIREFVPSARDQSVDIMLSVISRTWEFSKCSHLSIFAPFQGPVLDCTSKRIQADHHILLRPDSSNMFKWVAGYSQPSFDKLNLFIFQGDNL